MWQDFIAWSQSPGGARVMQAAIIPALVIVVAALVSALIARSAVRSMMRRSDRIEASSAVGALVAAARMATSGDTEHASRLRAEADVRTRLLPLPGAGLAADWAAARIDALPHPSAGEPTSELDELRDRLVAWVGRPSRAKRVFATVAAAPTSAPAAVEPEVAEVAPVDRAESDRAAWSEPGPRRTPPPEEPAVMDDSVPEPEPEPEVVAVPTAASAAAPGGIVPAWQRTRAGERLQQERFKTRAVEPPTVDDADLVPISTAPVQLSHAHRAPGAPSADADEAVRLEAHQQARHARPDEQAQAAAANGAAPAAPSTPAPAWLDTYDDEAQVTQNLDLKTPPPVSASAVRDRGAPGEDLVPRS